MLLRNQVYVTKMSPNITNLAKEIEIAMETTFPPLVGVWKCLLGIQVLERPLQVLVSFGSHNCVAYSLVGHSYFGSLLSMTSTFTISTFK